MNKSAKKAVKSKAREDILSGNYCEKCGQATKLYLVSCSWKDSQGVYWTGCKTKEYCPKCNWLSRRISQIVLLFMIIIIIIMLCGILFFMLNSLWQLIKFYISLFTHFP